MLWDKYKVVRTVCVLCDKYKVVRTVCVVGQVQSSEDGVCTLMHIDCGYEN